MSEIQVVKEEKTIIFTVEFSAPITSVWELWENPRKLEKWWGPPTYPATFTIHEFVEGGKALYEMTGPEGDTHHGWWEIQKLVPEELLVIVDGFADAEGNPNTELPTTSTQVSFTSDVDGLTTMSLATEFTDTEAMEKLIEMGVIEGMTAALGQTYELLGITQ